MAKAEIRERVVRDGVDKNHTMEVVLGGVGLISLKQHLF